jgi:hypothetical protein
VGSGGLEVMQKEVCVCVCARARVRALRFVRREEGRGRKPQSTVRISGSFSEIRTEYLTSMSPALSLNWIRH